VGRVGEEALISSNDHIMEPPHLWQSRLPAGLRDGAPRVIDAADGGQAWVFGEVVVPLLSVAAAAGQDPDTFSPSKPTRYEDLAPAAYEASARVRAMDQDGVQVHTCLPMLTGFAGGRLTTDLRDRVLGMACVRAYNDHMIEEWAGPAPGRLLAIGILPLWDVEAAVAEATRLLERGVHGISLPEDPTEFGSPGWHGHHWYPLLRLLEEAGIPITMHMGSSLSTVGFGAATPGEDRPFVVDLTLFHTTSISALVNLLLSPLFLDFPQLRIVLSESGIGWVPFFLEKADFYWRQHRAYARGRFGTRDVPPSELVPGHLHLTTQCDDRSGIELRHRIGVEQILWQSDYPHCESPWPDSQRAVAELLGGVPSTEAALIRAGNAQRLYRLADGAPPDPAESLRR
jgi:predicted TIM-barrel fold metal-dependent hydrolase